MLLVCACSVLVYLCDHFVLCASLLVEDHARRAQAAVPHASTTAEQSQPSSARGTGETEDARFYLTPNEAAIEAALRAGIALPSLFAASAYRDVFDHPSPLFPHFTIFLVRRSP